MRKVAKKVSKLSLFSQLSAPIKSGVKGRYYSEHDMNKDMVNRTRVEGGGYIKRDIIT